MVLGRDSSTFALYCGTGKVGCFRSLFPARGEIGEDLAVLEPMCCTCICKLSDESSCLRRVRDLMREKRVMLIVIERLMKRQ